LITPAFKKNISLILIWIGFLSTASRAFQNAGNFWYIAPLAFLLLIFLNLRELLIKGNLFNLVTVNLFGIWTLITSIWSLNPSVTFQRSLYLLLVINFSLLASVILLKNKSNLFSLLSGLLLVTVFSSLFSLLYSLPDNSWTGGNGNGFMGFTVHQNTLGSLILFSIPSIIYYYFFKVSLNGSNSKFRIQNSAFLLLFLLSLLILFLSHSRASLLSFLILTFLTGLFYKAKLTIVVVSLIIIFLILITVSIPVSYLHIKSYITKNTSSLLENRIRLWESSYQAADYGGLTGIGFGISHPEVKNFSKDGVYKEGRIIREKGNSFLALIEETGLIGFAFFLVPLFVIISKNLQILSGYSKIINSTGNQAIKHSNNPKALSLLPEATSFSLFTFHVLIIFSLLIHSQFEGWVSSVASFQILIYYLVLSSFFRLKDII
jgi:O-antigen ligase